MTRSMTAFGRAESLDKKDLSWVVEIQSVNRKILDINIYMPKELLFLEMAIRKELSKILSRGLITVKISYKKDESASVTESMLMMVKKRWTTVAKKLGYSDEVISLPFLLAQLERLSLQELGISEKQIKSTLLETLSRGCEQLLKMKLKEGKALNLDIAKRLKKIAAYLQEVSKSAGTRTEKYRAKLLDRLETVLADSTVDERVLKEVALYAEKVDITEEIVRLKSHLKQSESLLKGDEDSIGRTFDFLIQEMIRELNTIGSKASNLDITQFVVEAKAEVEKIREQVQNIE